MQSLKEFGQGPATSKSLPSEPGLEMPVEDAADVVRQGNFPVEEDGKVTAIITLGGAPVAQIAANLDVKSPLSLQVIQGEHKTAKDRLVQLGTSVEIKREFFYALNGFVARFPKEMLADVRALFGVENVHPQRIYTIDLDYSVPLVKGTDVWNTLGFKGEGQVVGVVDTGVDYNHPDLGGDGDQTKDWAHRASTAKIIDGYDFGEDDSDPMDYHSHGTHVSGIMCANGVVKGVAPEAKLVITKIVKGGEGSASSADIAAAFDWMTEKKLSGMNLVAVNMSFGFPGGINNPGDPEQLAISNLIATGVVVSLSAGNEATSTNQWFHRNYNTGKYTWYPADNAAVGSPCVTPGAIATAASWNTNSVYSSFLVTDGSGFRGPYTSSSVAEPVSFYGGVPQPFVYVSYGNDNSYYTGKDVAGKIALILRGGPGDATFVNKLTLARNHGASGALLMNDAARGDALMTMIVPEGFPLPALFTGYSYGTYLVNHPDSQILFDGQTAAFPNPLPDKRVDFSSWGTSPYLEMKPEVMAPGGGIWSTVPLALGGYDNFSGTSMAAPHVGGAAALIKQAHPTWTPQQIKTAILNTAEPRSDPATNAPYVPRLQGSGRLNILNAILNEVLITDSAGNPNAALGDTEGATTRTFQVKVSNSSTVTPFTFDLSGTVEMTHNGVHYLLSGATISFFQPGSTNPLSQITLAPGATASFDVKVDVTNAYLYASGTNRSLENYFAEGFVTLTPVGTGFTLQLPYVMFVGDWQNVSFHPGGYYAYNMVLDRPLDEWWWWWGNTWLYTQIGSSLYFLGFDFYGDAYRDLIAFSPNGDGVQDNIHPILNLMRSTDHLTMFVRTPLGMIFPLFNEYWVHKNVTRYPYWTGWDYNWLWAPPPDSFMDGTYELLVNAQIPTDVTEVTKPSAADGFALPFIIDTVAPEVLISPLVTEAEGSATINWTGSDDRSGLWGYDIYQDGALIGSVPPSVTSYTFPVSGAHEFMVVAWDNAGNYFYSAYLYKALLLSSPPGWSFLSFPVRTNPDPTAVFGLVAPYTLKYWDNLTQKWGAQGITLDLGEAYWLKLRKPYELTFSGVLDVNPSFSVPLVKGRNDVGVPYPGTILWEDVRVLKDGTSYSLDEAINNRLIRSVFAWREPSYQNVKGMDFEPGNGYVFNANADLTLVFPNPLF